LTRPSPETTPADVVTAAGSRELEAALRRAVELALEHEQRSADLPANTDRDPVTLASTLDLVPGHQGLELDEVMARLEHVLRTTPSSASPRFLNQLFGGRVAVSAAAEILTAVPNISMYTFKAAGAQILIELAVLGKLAEAAGLERGEGAFFPGGSIANLTAMVLARDRTVPAARNRGLDGSALVVYTSAEGHYSISKNAGILGLGRDQAHAVPVDDRGAMRVDSLRDAIASDIAARRRPMMVVATAGTTVRGAFDPIADIAGICAEHGLWLHVDGALGGTLLLSATHRHRLDGVERADSLTWDAHKMMGIPLQSSVLLTARRGLLAASLDERADYLFQADDETYNPGHRSIQCGRRNDALKLWAAWMRLGDAGWEARVDRQLDLARTAAALIDEDPDFELTEPPASINVCFEMRGVPSVALCDHLDRRGRLKIGHGRVQGRETIRLVCVNPDLGPEDLQRILDEIRKAGKDLRT
jgi:sulfinoalanine decarboxylase